MHALLKLEKITGTPGVIARAFKHSINPTIDEQAFFFPHEWHQSIVIPDYRWLGDLSVDQLNGWIIGLADYYDFIADDVEKNRIMKSVDRVMGRILNNDMRIIDVDGKMTLWGNLSPNIPHESLNALLSLILNLGLAKKMMIAATRMVVQLLLLGLVLKVLGVAGAFYRFLERLERLE